MVSKAPESPRVGSSVLWGMFLVSLGLLVLEVTITRLLSVAMAYHFAVLSVSLAMLGLVFGGVFVHVHAERIACWGARRTAGTAAVAAGVATLVGFLCLLGLPIRPVPSLAGVLNLGLLFVPQLVPFLCFGVAISTLFATYPGSVSRLYLADLVGAGVGCLAVAFGLPYLTGGGMVLASAAVTTTGGWLLLGAAGRQAAPRYLDPRAWLLVLGVCLLAAVTSGTFELVYVKGQPEWNVERVDWTAHSRLSFSGEIWTTRPFGWGLGTRFEPALPAYSHRRIRIDGMAETPILRWDGSPDEVGHLAWDVTMLPYRLRGGGRALIIGSGGGRDIVAAVTSGDWQVTAAEINEGIVHEVATTYSEYGGGVYSRPDVVTRIRDGRSVIEQSPPASYDVIQLSAVDTWATGSVGSFALMENGLYTVEAFRAALRALTPGGLLAVSRFKYAGDEFGEVARMVVVAMEAVAAEVPAATRPADHLLLASNTARFGAADSGMVTMLVSPVPLTATDIERTLGECRRRGFLLVWPVGGVSPAASPVAELLALPQAQERREFIDDYPIDIRPTHDDRPYFFNQTRLATLASLDPAQGEMVALRLAAYLTLVRLALFLVVACSAVVCAPFVLTASLPRPRLSWAQLAYFAALGIGFMFYEIPIIQKLTLGLGHPTYALAVVLAGLLVGSGVGSLLSGRIPATSARWAHPVMAAVAGGIGLVIVALGDTVTGTLFRLDATPRVVLAGGSCLAIGLVLGMLFPLGIRLLCAGGGEAGVAWAWATNGAASVVASVVSLIVGIELGMATTIALGALAYLLCVAIAWAGWRRLAAGTAAHR